MTIKITRDRLSSGRRAMSGVGINGDEGGDYAVKQARKTYACKHRREGCGRISTPCHGDIEPRDLYVRARQSWLDWEPLNLLCAADAEIVVVRPTGDGA